MRRSSRSHSSTRTVSSGSRRPRLHFLAGMGHQREQAGEPARRIIRGCRLQVLQSPADGIHEVTQRHRPTAEPVADPAAGSGTRHAALAAVRAPPGTARPPRRPPPSTAVPNHNAYCAAMYASVLSYLSARQRVVVGRRRSAHVLDRALLRYSATDTRSSPMMASASKTSPNTSCANLYKRLLPLAAERGRRPDARERARRRPEPCLESPDQAREIRALRPIERVQLIHDQEPERVRRVVLATAPSPAPGSAGSPASCSW